MTETDRSQQREAAESASDLREMMAEILRVPSGDDQHIEAKRHAVVALEGIDRAEKALRLWRDCEEGSVDLLDGTNSEGDNDPTTPAEMREKLNARRWAMEDERG